MGELRRTTEIRRVELTDAALHIIEHDGIAALSTRSLAEHVGLTTGAIFRHFPSIDALLEAVVERVESVLDSTFPPSDLPPRERLERFVLSRSTTVGNQAGILRLVPSEQFFLALPKDGSARLAACVHKTHSFVRDCLREGQHTGDFRDDVDANALAIVVMGTMRMLAISASRPVVSTNPRAVRETLFALLARAPRAHGKHGKRRAS